MTRVDAQAILDAHVKNGNLKKHMYAVEAAMRYYAAMYKGDPDEWGITGLLHDFDWEIHPTLDAHPVQGQAILEHHGVPPHIRHAILTHAKHTGVPPQTAMEKAVFACDELTGLIVAVALVSPHKKLSEVTVDRVMKKMGQRAFAANVNREEIREGASLLGLPVETHVQHVLSAMQGIADVLGL